MDRDVALHPQPFEASLAPDILLETSTPAWPTPQATKLAKVATESHLELRIRLRSLAARRAPRPDTIALVRLSTEQPEPPFDAAAGHVRQMIHAAAEAVRRQVSCH